MIIKIMDFSLVGCIAFHLFFQPLEVTRHTLLSDKMEFYFFKLKKLPEDISEKDALLLWLSLFRAETEEDLEKSKKWGCQPWSKRSMRTIQSQHHPSSVR